MDTKPLEKFAQAARRQLHEQVKARLAQVLQTDSPELRAKANVVAELNKQIAQSSRQAVIERVAYTWFNRFCALRYMDANRYTRLGIVSPAVSPTGEAHTQPEVLQEVKAGHIDEELARFIDSQRVFDLLSGRLPSPDGQGEAYRLLLVGSCNQYHAVMPFLFEKIDDYTELLMPDDLLSASSVLAAAREVLTEDVCQDVEVIGWLYQFYISEKKDAVIGAKKAITPENIPAATQLFTPNWIVRYLVQNSLGRLWLLNRPHSRLAAQMEFYIGDRSSVNGNSSDTTDNGSPITDYLKINTPEDLTVCDPAVGSAHMLTYAFELLYAIYEEEGYSPPDIPRLILQHNLVGLEIDERAAALAAFALVMKARAKDRRFFRRGVMPQITTLRPIQFSEAELDAEVQNLSQLSFRAERSAAEESSALAGGKDSSEEPRNDTEEALRHDLTLFKEADNFGSLLRPLLSARQLRQLDDHLNRAAPTGQLQMFDQERRRKVRQAIAQALPLARHYAVVVANPPYLGNFNDSLKKFAQTRYPDSKSDLFAMFMERNLDFAVPHGQVAMINMQSWMFLSSYEKLREKLLSQYAIASMAHIGARGFDTIGGEVVSTTAFVLENAAKPDSKGAYVRLVDGRSEAEKADTLREAIQNPDCGYFYRAASSDFKKIPGYPIAYWASHAMLRLFSDGLRITDFINSRDGLTTGKNELFIRYHWEVESNAINFHATNPDEFWESKRKFAPLIKGGSFRKWYGNLQNVITYDKSSYRVLAESGNKLPSREFYFRENLNWTRISSPAGSFRYTYSGCVFESASLCAFSQNDGDLKFALSCANSCIAIPQLNIVNPTTNLLSGYFDTIRLPESSVKHKSKINFNANKLISKAKSDWDSYETSWDFTTLPLLQAYQHSASLRATYTALRQGWQAATLEMQRLEEENNRFFIEAYGLQDELTPDVPLSEITLTCNPHYRYSSNKSEAELEALLLADTMREFISYAVGCMFGRYSLDKPGPILANQGETVEDYLRKVSFRGSSEESSTMAEGKDSSHAFGMTGEGMTFIPDTDNAIPMLDGDWFSDDITERFKKFLRVTFGEAHYAENLAFIEAALGRDIRSYFLRDFYDHHVRMYKKRPIYWLFSSPKGSFNVLIYMHRYRPDTVSVVLNDYLREFRAKLSARKSLLEGVSASASSSPRDKTRALKEISDLDKTLKEIREYEDDILYTLATRQVQIDLDDGVKVNYNKFGQALKKVTGLTET